MRVIESPRTGIFSPLSISGSKQHRIKGLPPWNFKKLDLFGFAFRCRIRDLKIWFEGTFVGMTGNVLGHCYFVTSCSSLQT